MRRTATKLVMDTMHELADAEEAMLIVVHASGDISWHTTTDRLHANAGIVRYVEIQLDEKIRRADDVTDEPLPAETTH